MRCRRASLLANLVLLVTAGFETTTNLLGNGLALLLDDRSRFDDLRARPELAPQYVREMLRYDPPVQLTARWASEAIDFDGVSLAKHGFVLILIGAANRDAAHFATPDTFEARRAGEPEPLSFGAGPHFCAGAALARMEAEVAFPKLVRRFPAMTLADKPVRRDRLTLRGYERLPILVA